MAHSPMAARVDEVKARMNTMILNISTIQSRFITKILVILLINIVYNWLPTAKEYNIITYPSHFMLTTPHLSTQGPVLST